MFKLHAKHTYKLLGKEIMTILRSTILLTVNHLILAASKFVGFKRLAYWCSLILAVSQFNVL